MQSEAEAQWRGEFSLQYCGFAIVNAIKKQVDVPRLRRSLFFVCFPSQRAYGAVRS
jgi:hypothetical protein